jgi:sugar/nucleoside kinase (ribokinase family)
MDIIGLGTVAMDVIMQVDTLPKEDGFAVVKNKKYLEGGSATNAIVQAARLGAECGFIAQVGDDEIGDAIKAGLEKENVDTSLMVSKKGGVSLHTTIVVGEDGKKFILLNMGDAFLSLQPDDVDYEKIKCAKIFYTDLLPGEPAINALKKAKEAGLKTVLNLQVGIPMMEQFGVPQKVILEALNYVDVFAPCRESFSQLTGTGNYEAGIQSFMKNYKGLLLLTLGSEGSAASDGNQITKVPIYNIDVKDTTGAGDSYIGSFIYGYCIQGWDIKKSMEFSTVASALTCTEVGARACPRLSEIEEAFKLFNK